ncbi:MAG: hypothetical protein MJA84_04620 [Firmicutes bacterium]|nr:hypothetical protein [Bacillota bacterium]
MKFIVYSCADCLNDNGIPITFAVQSGANIQNGVHTPISCPVCQEINTVVAQRETEIDLKE